jgi:hypothetical protein
MKVFTMSKRFSFLLVFAVFLAGIAPALAQPMRPGGEEQVITPKPPLSSVPDRGEEEGWIPWFRHRLGEGEPKFRGERRRRLQRAREMAQRLLNDPSAPDEIKAKARRLTDLLSKREGLVRELDSKRQNFNQEHEQELSELRQLRERGELIRQRLRAAREKAIYEKLPIIQEMRQTTREARDVAVELLGYYRQRGHGPERLAPPGGE